MKGKYGRTPIKKEVKKKKRGRPNILGESGVYLQRLEGFSFCVEEEIKRRFDVVHNKLTRLKAKKGLKWNRQNTLRVILRRGVIDIPDEWLVEAVDELLPTTTKIQMGVVELDDQVRDLLTAMLLTYNSPKVRDLKAFSTTLQAKWKKTERNNEEFVEALNKLVNLIGGEQSE